MQRGGQNLNALARTRVERDGLGERGPIVEKALRTKEDAETPAALATISLVTLGFLRSARQACILRKSL